MTHSLFHAANCYGRFLAGMMLINVVSTANAQIAKSTLADTIGFAKDLRWIETKLGPLKACDQLKAIEVQYYSFADPAYTQVDTKTLYSGILIVHACMVADVQAIFDGLRQDTFPIAKVIPINRYGLNADTTGWDDMASMADNNTSAFNYRSKSVSTDPSKHAMGLAIDINPLFNPMMRREGGNTTVLPAAGRYEKGRSGTLTHANILKHLERRGWSWGGRWPKPQDYQHIEKSHGRCMHFDFKSK